MPRPDAATTDALRVFAEDLGRGVSIAKMFGMPTLKAGGKAFAGVWGDGMNFKLPKDVHARALKLRGAELFDPSGLGRPMREWVLVPKAHRRRWKELAAAGRRCVAGR